MKKKQLQSASFRDATHVVTLLLHLSLFLPLPLSLPLSLCPCLSVYLVFANIRLLLPSLIIHYLAQCIYLLICILYYGWKVLPTTDRPACLHFVYHSCKCICICICICRMQVKFAFIYLCISYILFLFLLIKCNKL